MKEKKGKPVFLWISVAVFAVTLFLIIIQNLQPSLTLPGFTLFGEQEQPQQTEYTLKKPEEVVRQYFESWNRKDYPNMYATLSDGFKKIDPNARDLNTFINFANSQEITGIKVLDIKEESNDGRTAVGAYSVEFTLSDGSKQKFSDKLTLKFRQGDVILGWKLIHPYGPNVDTS